MTDRLEGVYGHHQRVGDHLGLSRFISRPFSPHRET